MAELDLPEDSAFHPANASAVTIITLARIYDLLTILALNTDEDKTLALLKKHSEGEFGMPDISFRMS